ncbi:MAG: hypothetical protein LM517_01180 [Nitrosomonas sp.]|nr:hypothetical protein [Nitrosomonas sp.]
MGYWRKSTGKSRLTILLLNRVVDASIAQSPRKPKTKPAYEVVSDREERDDENEAEKAMQVIEVTQPGVDAEARWFNAKVLRYCGLAKAHAWHTLLAMAYNLKRLPKIFAERQMIAKI